MRKTQILKANRHSKIGVIIADVSDTTLPNADKNNRITRKNHKNIDHQINHFIKKRSKFTKQKNFIVIIVQERHF